MTRPRMAAIASAIAASAVAFLVVSRWSLAGTLTGAAVIPILYTLVSHWSAESLDHLGKWIRRRVSSSGSLDESTEPTPPESARSGAGEHADLAAGGGIVPERQAPKRGSSGIQWSLAAFASLALAVSIYSLLLSGPVETTIVRERVIERTATVTTQAARSVVQAPSAYTSTTTVSMTEEPSTVPTAPATTSPSQTGPLAEPSPTTDPGQIDQGEEPAPTASTVPITTTSLR
jgi:hypothetical protein